MSPQSIMSSKKASNSSGLCPAINSQACLWVSPRPHHHIRCWSTNQCLILLRISCLETPKAESGPPNSSKELSLASSSQISLSSTQHVQGPNTAHCKTGRSIIQSLLASLDQWRCSDGLKSFQSSLTIRADTRVLLWTTLKLHFINTHLDRTYLSHACVCQNQCLKSFLCCIFQDILGRNKINHTPY